MLQCRTQFLDIYALFFITPELNLMKVMGECEDCFCLFIFVCVSLYFNAIFVLVVLLKNQGDIRNIANRDGKIID